MDINEIHKKLLKRKNIINTISESIKFTSAGNDSEMIKKDNGTVSELSKLVTKNGVFYTSAENDRNRQWGKSYEDLDKHLK